MDVLGEILEWSKTQPDWQRDALRRLAASGELTEADIEKLCEICKSKHGLAEAQELNPLTKDNLPTSDSEAGQVNVQSISHHRGVNALAEDQTVTFGPGLTVLYGDNAAGKSGYTRIFKSTCRARGTEDILGNVVSGSTPPAMSVEIKYTVGDDGTDHVWAGEGSDESIARVSVFDSHSAKVYLTEKTDVAFRPFGLDLFDKLAQSSKAVRERLEREQKALGAGGLQTLELPEGTAAAKLVASISSLTDPKQVVALAALSEDENARRQLLDKQLVDLRAKDPAKAAQELRLRSGRLRSLVEHFNGRCMEKAEGSSPYCKQHKFEHYVRQRKLNRRAGLCKCGNKPIDGQSARGKRYTTCMTCLTKQRAYDGARLAEIKALPDDIRRYAGNGRHAGFRALALSLHRVEQDRRDKAIEAAQPVLPKLDNRKRLFIQKHVELGASWGVAEKAAIMAGYGKISAYQGGRSAAVKASVLLKRADIQRAIREYRTMLYQDEQVRLAAEQVRLAAEQVRLAAEQRAANRAMINTIIDNLKMHVSDSQPQSRAAQVLRRLQGQPVKRVPGYCVCGDPVTEGYASCKPCRIKHRHYRQAERAAKRERRTCHYGR